MAESHLFVTMGNILHLRCDAWLAPTDEELNMEPGWTAAVAGLSDAVNLSASPSFRQGKSFAAAALDWPETEPLPVFTSVPVEGVQSADELRPRIAAFLREASRAVLAMPRRETAQTRKYPY